MSLVIRKLDELINSTLKDERRFLSCEYKNLLPPGENYGSIMLQMQIKVINRNGDEEVVHCVGKTTPPTEFIWQLFNTKVTFKKEIAVYNIVVPALKQFTKTQGLSDSINFFPECLGARTSLDSNTNAVDADAVLLLENLRVQGYGTCDRFIGFDLDCAKFILTDLATLHAVTIAYKMKEPNLFNSKVRPYLNRDFSFNFEEIVVSQITKGIQEGLTTFPECRPHLPKVEEAIRKLTSYSIEAPLKERELFATFTHNDYWVNNTMLKFEDGKPVGNKMIDFQTIEYRSLAHDVLFFLYSSVELSVLEEHLNNLFEYYYQQFIGKLEQYGCDDNEFSFEAMLDEFRYIGKEEELGHILFMMPGTMKLREKATELTELKKDYMMMKQDAVHENCPKKLRFILLDFVKRGWV